MTDSTSAGDFEGILTYGIGVTRPDPDTNGQLQVRVYEVTHRDASGEQRHYASIGNDSAVGLATLRSS